MRTKKLFSMKKAMRAMALSLATVLVVGSLNVMEVSAGADTTVTYPQYKDGEYAYSSGDIFGAATHVHLFGNYVKTSAHTHGNVMAEVADLSEIGMREGKISYPLEYREVHYVGTGLVGASSNITGDLVLGKGIDYNDPYAAIVKVNEDSTLSPNGTVDLNRYVQGDIIQEAADKKVVDIAGTLSYLKTKSRDWSNMEDSTLPNGDKVAEYDLSSDQNNRYIDVNQDLVGTSDNVIINLTYDDWRTVASGDPANPTATQNPITIKGLDSDVNHTGIVIINIDLKDAPTNAEGRVVLTLNEIKAQDINNNMYHNTEHTTAAFGGCRIVYNLYDSSETDRIFKGKVEFANTVYGNILAPGADIVVGAINGSVMADSIVHSGQESHRLDIYPIFTDANSATHKEYDEIRLLLTLEGTEGTDNGDSSQTDYTLCTYDKSTGQYVPVDATNDAFNEIEAVWNKNEEKYEIIINSSEVTAAIRNTKLTTEKSYYLVKGDIHPEYKDNDTVFEVVINGDGTIKYAEHDEGNHTDSPEYSNTVLTDVLKKKVSTPITIEDLVLNLDLEGDTEDYAPGAESGTSYKVYSDASCSDGTEITDLGTIPATWNADEKIFQVKITKDKLTTDTTYYLKKVEPVTTGYDSNTNKYEAIVGTDGNITYRETTGTNAFTGESKEGPLEDVLTKTTVVVDVEDLVLNLDLIGDDTTGYTVGKESGTSYKVYSDESCTTEVTELGTIPATWNDTDKTFQVVIDGDKLTAGETYYLKKVEPVTEGYDTNTNKYEAKVDENSGNITYRETNTNTFSGTYAEGPLKDELNKTPVVVQPNDEIVINVVFSGPNAGEPTDADGSTVKYQIYKEPACDPADAISGLEATITKDASGNWKVVFDAEDTEDLAKDTDYYITVSNNGSGFKDEKTEPYKVKFNPQTGATQYGVAGGYVATSPTDKLIKNEGIELEVEFTGEPFTGTNSDVTYDIYDEDGNKVTTTPIEANDSNDDDLFEVTVDSSYTTENLDRDKLYYIGISGNESGYTDKSKDQYWVKFDENGKVSYSTDKNASDDKWSDTPLKDTLVKTPAGANDKIEINVEFSGPEGTSPSANSGVKYELLEKDASGNLVPVKDANGNDVVKEAIKDGTGWKVEFGLDVTEDLDKDKDYFVKVSDNGSDYKDKSEDTYKVKFDSQTGETKYYDETVNDYVTTPPTDQLFKNDKIELDVELEGETAPAGGTGSNVKYDIFTDPEKENVVPNTNSQEAIFNDQKGKYEIIIDSDITNELDRSDLSDGNSANDKIYYIGISNNSSGYTDKEEESFMVKIDQNGDAWYSKDGNSWQKNPMVDVLEKNDPTGGNTNTGGTGGSTTDPGNGGNSGNSNANNNTTTNKTNTTVTDGANNNSLTGGNNITSAKTGEVNTALIFGGFVAVLAAAAGVYVFIKRKRA